jgi:hypothetical protein
LREGFQHRRLPRLDVIRIAERRIDRSRRLEGLVYLAQLARAARLFESLIHRRNRGKRPFDGDGVRRHADAAIGEILELGGDRRRVGDYGLFPFVKAVGEDEVATALAAIAMRPGSLSIDATSWAPT